jgi:hypothetical protein
MDSGEIEVQRVLSDTVQASWDTSLRVRSTGGRVEVSGNPSKWGRLDAVTGFGDLWDCIAVYNRVLEELGLSPSERRGRLRTEDGEQIRTGPQISRVDLTRNLVASREGVRPFLDWMESQVWGSRLSFRRSGMNTIGAGGRNRRQRVFRERSSKKTARKGIYDKLVAKGYSERMAETLQKVAISWMNGGEWKLGTSRRTAYRYAGILRRECGLDIRKAMNVRSIALCIKPKVLEVRPLTKEDLPDWYNWEELKSAA